MTQTHLIEVKLISINELASVRCNSDLAVGNLPPKPLRLPVGVISLTQTPQPLPSLSTPETRRALTARSFGRKCPATRKFGDSGCDRVARERGTPTSLEKHIFTYLRIRTFPLVAA